MSRHTGDLPVQQPDYVNGDTMIYVVGYTGGFGAEVCKHVTKQEAARRLAERHGAGTLIEKDGKFFWRTSGV